MGTGSFTADGRERTPDEYREHLRSLNLANPRTQPRKSFVIHPETGQRVQKTELIRDTDGARNGYTLNHKDDRQDAQVFLDAPQLTMET